LEFHPDSIELPFSRSASVKLVWSPRVEREALGARPTVFVHLVDAEGEVLRTFDHALDTSAWSVGVDFTSELDLYQSQLGPALEPGRYRLLAGLYEPGGERYALEGEKPLSNDALEVAEIVVPASSAPLAGLEYVGDWQGLERTQDVQTLMRRWLGDGGGFSVQLAGDAVQLVLSLNLVEGIQDHDLTGEGTLHVEIQSSCGQGAEIFGAGIHPVTLTLEPSEDSDPCQVDLIADSMWTDRESGMRRTVLLEVLTLRAVD